MVNQVQFNIKDTNYSVFLKAAQEPSQGSVLIGGIHYTLEGQSEAIALFNARVSGLNLASMQIEELQSRLSILDKGEISAYALKAMELGPEVLMPPKEPATQKSQVLSQITPSPYIPGVSIKERLAELGIQGLRLSVIDGAEVWTEGFGELEKPRLIQAASLSKTLTALTILTLIEAEVETPKGLLTLDTKVEDILDPLLWESISPDKHSITLRQLMSHTAGLEKDTPEGYRGYCRVKELEAAKIDEQISKLREGPSEPSIEKRIQELQKAKERVLEGQLPTLDDILKGEGTNSPPVLVTTPPGNRYAYSGGGAMILQKVIETLNPQQSFEEVVTEKVFNPLQMTSTFSPAEARVAQGYDGDGSPLPGGWVQQPELAAAGLWSTPEDLTKPIIEIQKALRGESRLISQKLAKEMLQEPEGVDFAHNEIAGLGVFIAKTDQAAYFYHDGSNIGYRCLMIGNDKGQGAVIMTNSDVGDVLFSEIIRTVAQVYNWPGKDSLDIRPLLPFTAEVDKNWADTHEGEYRKEGVAVNIVPREGKIYFKPPGGEELLITPISENVGLIKENQIWFSLEFKKDQSNIILTVHDMEHTKEK